MTAQDPATLKAKFENGDVPQGSDYVDVFDSFVNVVQSTAQVIQGPVTFQGQIITSATANFNKPIICSATASFNGPIIVSGTANFGPVITSATAKIDAVLVQRLYRRRQLDYSVTGNTQASAVAISTPIARVVNATAAGRAIKLPAGNAFGAGEYLIVNDSATDVLVFPTTGDNFQGYTVNSAATVATASHKTFIYVGGSGWITL